MADPAVIGLLGALGGVVASTGGQLILDSRRARREQEAESRRVERESAAETKREIRELRLSVRLVMEELSESASLISNAAKSRRYWLAPRQLPTMTWGQYRTDIASVIDSPLDWRFITSAYEAVNDLNWVVQNRRDRTTAVNDHQHGVRVDALDETREKWRAIRQAIGALEQTIEVTGPASRVMREADDAEREYWPFGDGADFNLEDAMDAEREEIENERRWGAGY